MTKEELNKKYQVTKNRSKKSLDRLAESFMLTANKIIGTVLLSMIIIPLTGSLNAIYFNSTLNLNIADNLMYWLFVFVLYFMGIYMPIQLRRMALDIWDYLDESYCITR